MKVVYFIQSHKNPKQVCRLVKVIKTFSPNSLVLLSHDFSCSPLDLNELRQFYGIELIKRKKSVRRGDDSVLAVYLSIINWLFEHNYDYDWLICLSGQDYPVLPIPEIETFLATTEYDGFITYWNLYSEKSPWGKEGGQKRYFVQYVKLPEWSKWWLRKMTRIEPFVPLLNIQWRYALIGLQAQSTPFNDNFRCYGGWYWNTLSKKCVDLLRNYLVKHPELLKYYQRTLAPEESIVATILVNSKEVNICNDCLRYLDFPTELGGCARNLTTVDYDKIVNKNFHFARKFDPKPENNILDLLDERLDTRANNEAESSNIVRVRESSI